MELFIALLLIIVGYISGSIPTAFIAGRLAKGIDLRNYGSGTVSGSMVWEHVSRWILFPVGIFDMIKSAAPVWLSLALGQNSFVASSTGLAAIAGHNWPFFLGFIGGRGLSPFLGVLVVLFPAGFIWMLGFLGIGFALGDSAPWALVSIASMPLLVWRLDGDPAVYYTIAGMFILTLVKRVEANRRLLPPPGKERRKVIIRRLLFDRDISSHREWIDRTPD